MSKDWRIFRKGQRLSFTCENSKFKTDISRGYKHFSDNNYLGSAIPEPIYTNGIDTLWIEYVINVKDKNNKCFWFMWYKNGIPSLSGSSVIDEDDIMKVINNISKIKIQ